MTSLPDDKKQNDPNPSNAVPDEINIFGVELEYTTLRNEILKRIELRQQIVSITLTLAGIFLGVGIGMETVALIYPPLAMFLAFGWAQNDIRIRDAASYIRDNLENPELGLQYETHVQKIRDKGQAYGGWRFVIFSHGGIFLVTQVMAIGVSLVQFALNPLGIGLLLIDIGSVGVVVWLLFQADR